jgi:hypothetical protein
VIFASRPYRHGLLTLGCASAQDRRQAVHVPYQGGGPAVAAAIEGGEGPARIKMTMLRHGGAPSVAVEQRRRCHALAARPIASAHEETYASQQRAEDAVSEDYGHDISGGPLCPIIPPGDHAVTGRAARIAAKRKAASRQKTPAITNAGR